MADQAVVVLADGLVTRIGVVVVSNVRSPSTERRRRRRAGGRRGRIRPGAAAPARRLVVQRGPPHLRRACRSRPDELNPGLVHALAGPHNIALVALNSRIETSSPAPRHGTAGPGLHQCVDRCTACGHGRFPRPLAAPARSTSAMARPDASLVGDNVRDPVPARATRVVHRRRRRRRIADGAAAGPGVGVHLGDLEQHRQRRRCLGQSSTAPRRARLGGVARGRHAMKVGTGLGRPARGAAGSRQPSG